MSSYEQARQKAHSAFEKKLITAQRRDLTLKQIQSDESAHKAEINHRILKNARPDHL